MSYRKSGDLNRLFEKPDGGNQASYSIELRQLMIDNFIECAEVSPSLTLYHWAYADMPETARRAEAEK